MLWTARDGSLASGETLDRVLGTLPGPHCCILTQSESESGCLVRIKPRFWLTHSFCSLTQHPWRTTAQYESGNDPKWMKLWLTECRPCSSPRQPHECAGPQSVHGSLGRIWAGNGATASGPQHIGALVCTGAGVTVATAPRTSMISAGFRASCTRFSIRSPAIPSGAARAGPSGSCARGPRRAMGTRSRHVGRAAPRLSASGHTVVQLRIDETQPAAFHYETGQRLAPLREEGVLIAAAATWCITCTRTRGESAPSNPMTGRWGLRSRRRR